MLRFCCNWFLEKLVEQYKHMPEVIFHVMELGSAAPVVPSGAYLMTGYVTMEAIYNSYCTKSVLNIIIELFHSFYPIWYAHALYKKCMHAHALACIVWNVCLEGKNQVIHSTCESMAGLDLNIHTHWWMMSENRMRTQHFKRLAPFASWLNSIRWCYVRYYLTSNTISSYKYSS